ncbi:hypothetical protein ACTQV0_06215 [Selenomonas montiformis]|uniref:hypothetical protein n=1 Tax=Selenomonas montiformis TaxID=2652285 RepID=UPI003F8B72A5
MIDFSAERTAVCGLLPFFSIIFLAFSAIFFESDKTGRGKKTCREYGHMVSHSIAVAGTGFDPASAGDRWRSGDRELVE